MLRRFWINLFKVKGQRSLNLAKHYSFQPYLQLGMSSGNEIWWEGMNRHIHVQLLHMNIYVYTCQSLHIVSIGVKGQSLRSKVTKIWPNIHFSAITSVWNVQW